jgi:hypothetical protein
VEPTAMTDFMLKPCTFIPWWLWPRWLPRPITPGAGPTLSCGRTRVFKISHHTFAEGFARTETDPSSAYRRHQMLWAVEKLTLSRRIMPIMGFEGQGRERPRGQRHLRGLSVYFPSMVTARTSCGTRPRR